MNPAVARQHFVSDNGSRVMPGGRLSIYGSYDLSGNNSDCSDVLHVFSTDTMTDRTDHAYPFP